MADDEVVPTPAVMASPMTTYRRADGELVYGEYLFVMQPEFFEDVDEPVEVIKETWTLTASERVTFTPPGWTGDDDD